MGTGMRKTLGLVGIVAAATYITISNRKRIKHKADEVAEGAKERSALALHNRIGMPVYAYLKKKNYIPF
tara:strand:- start:62 stop:268 length:207 start_codon:yes stop_codon:yes gene_type:complete